VATTQTVTVLFTDLVGSTELSSRLGPQATDELRQTHFGLLRGAIQNAGGIEVKNLGTASYSLRTFRVARHIEEEPQMPVRAIIPGASSAMRLATLVVSVGALLVAVAPAAHGATARSWSTLPPLPHARAGLNVEQTDNEILAIGGFDSNRITGATEARPSGGPGNWHDVATMPTARTNFASAVVGSFVYAAGGYDRVDETKVVERYDPKLNQWTTRQPLPQPRGGDAGASLNGLLYVAGGYITPSVGPDELTATVLVYDPKRDSWSNVAPMHTPRERLRLVAAGRFLYAIGGVDANGNSLTTVEQYNPRTNQWVTIAPLQASRAFPGVAYTSIAGHPVIVVVGGAELASNSIVGPRQTTEVLNIATGTWHTLNVLLDPGRGGLSCAIGADGALLAIGGATIVNDKTVFLSDVASLRLEPIDLS
jgi:hypothetical protein